MSAVGSVVVWACELPTVPSSAVVPWLPLAPLVVGVAVVVAVTVAVMLASVCVPSEAGRPSSPQARRVQMPPRSDHR